LATGASDFIGVIAGARCKDQQVRDDDDDIVRWGGFDDLENFKRKAALLTDDDPSKTENLRRRSWAVASQLARIYWWSRDRRRPARAAAALSRPSLRRCAQSR
jgi:hypothetical protein